jgi:hypothetical protein
MDLYPLILESTDLQQAAEINSTRNVNVLILTEIVIFNQQINIHLDISHKVIGIKRCHHGMSV